ncbi:MAG: hypothetical protein V4850_02070 [Myxococcota bacterium]
MLSVFAFALLVGCNADDPTVVDPNKDKPVEEEPDEEPPIIVHEAVTGTQTFGADIAIQATVTDLDGQVAYVELHYKNEVDGASDWKKIPMPPASGDVYSGTIPGDDHRGGGVDYYIEAVDYAQNVAFSPDGGESDPYHFRIAE